MIVDMTPRWVAGEQLAIVWPGGAALVDSSVGLAAAERIWSRLHRESQLGTFLKALSEVSETGFLDLPSFAIVVRDGVRCHVAVRGAVTVEMWQDGALETLSGEGITTWAEKVLPDPDALRLGSTSEDAEAGPIADGVVPSSGLLLGEFPDPHEAREAVGQVAASEPGAEAESDPVPAGMDDREGEGIDDDPPPSEAQEPAVEPTLTPTPAVAASAEASTWMDQDLEDPLDTSVQPRMNPYDSLWDESIAMDVEAAAIRGDIVVDGDASDATRHDEPNATRPPSAEQLAGDTVADEGMVDVVMPGNGTGPQVLARFCDRGHANPPERAACFVCGSEVSGDARRTPRPPLGWIRVEGGETIALRGPVIAGRNPKSTALKLDETPRLVALPHPHVSSTHLAILIEGWQLLVRDLRSSNGTYLRRHGKPAVRLPETAVPLVSGDLIDLGKGLFIHLDRTP